MKKAIKREVKNTLDSAIIQVFEKLEIAKPSKNTKRAISKVSKKIARDLQKQLKKAVNKISQSKKKIATKTAQVGHLVEK